MGSLWPHRRRGTRCTNASPLVRLGAIRTQSLTHTFDAPTGAALNIRSTLIDGEPWFIAVDVVRAPGLAEHNAYTHTRPLAEDERRVVTASQLVSQSDCGAIKAALGQGARSSTRFTVISESGLYKMTMRSTSRTPVPSKIGSPATSSPRSARPAATPSPPARRCPCRRTLYTPCGNLASKIPPQIFPQPWSR